MTRPQLNRLDLGRARTETRDGTLGQFVEMLAYPSRTPVG